VVAAAGYLPGLALERSTTGLTQDLVTIEPHSDTTFEMVGNVGVAVTVLGLCLLLTTALAPLRVILTPVSAMGALSLTVYSAHIVVIRILGNEAVYNPTSNRPLIALVVGSMVFATIWQLTLGQGPLERVLHRLIKPPEPPQQAPPWPPQAQPPLGQQQPAPWSGQQPQTWPAPQPPYPAGQLPHPTAYPPPPPPR